MALGLVLGLVASPKMPPGGVKRRGEKLRLYAYAYAYKLQEGKDFKPEILRSLTTP